MICQYCEQVFVLADVHFAVKGEGNKWYHPECLKKKNDEEEKEKKGKDGK